MKILKIDKANSINDIIKLFYKSNYKIYSCELIKFHPDYFSNISFVLNTDIIFISLNKEWNLNYENFFIELNNTFITKMYIPFQKSACLFNKNSSLRIIKPIKNKISNILEIKLDAV